MCIAAWKTRCYLGDKYFFVRIIAGLFLLRNTDIVFIIRNVQRTLFLLIVSAPPAHVTGMRNTDEYLAKMLYIIVIIIPLSLAIYNAQLEKY